MRHVAFLQGMQLKSPISITRFPTSSPLRWSRKAVLWAPAALGPWTWRTKKPMGASNNTESLQTKWLITLDGFQRAHFEAMSKNEYLHCSSTCDSRVAEQPTLAPKHSIGAARGSSGLLENHDRRGVLNNELAYSDRLCSEAANIPRNDRDVTTRIHVLSSIKLHVVSTF